MSILCMLNLKYQIKSDKYRSKHVLQVLSTILVRLSYDGTLRIFSPFKYVFDVVAYTSRPTGKASGNVIVNYTI